MSSLPVEITLKNNIIIAEDIQEGHVSELFKIVQKNLSTQQSGLAPLDIQSERHLQCMIQSSPVKARYTIKSSGKCIGFSVALPSELCRSCRPITVRGFTFLDPAVTKIGIGQRVLRAVRGWSSIAGFPVGMARLSISSQAGK